MRRRSRGAKPRRARLPSGAQDEPLNVSGGKKGPPAGPFKGSKVCWLRLMRITPVHAAGKKLQDAIKSCRRYLFVFLANRTIEPTNNGSERALRPCVIFRKVTNCFRSQWGANLYADIRSVIETARRRAIGALQAIRLTLIGAPLPVPAPHPSG
jgi:hypothetical protein